MTLVHEVETLVEMELCALAALVEEAPNLDRTIRDGRRHECTFNAAGLAVRQGAPPLR